MNTHLEDLDVSGVIFHKPWTATPGSLILTVVIAGPAGIGSNYPEGAPPEALLPWQISPGLWIAHLSGFVWGFTCNVRTLLEPGKLLVLRISLFNDGDDSFHTHYLLMQEPAGTS